MEYEIVERKVKDIRVGDVIIRKKQDRIVTKVEPRKSYLASQSSYYDRFIITYDDGSQDNLHKSTSVISTTPRR